MAGPNPSDDEKTKLGFWIVVIGIVVAALVFVAALYKYNKSNDVATSIGPVTTLIGTLAGAFFGQQVGSAGKDKAQKTALTLALQHPAVSLEDAKKMIG